MKKKSTLHPQKKKEKSVTLFHNYENYAKI